MQSSTLLVFSIIVGITNALIEWKDDVCSKKQFQTVVVDFEELLGTWYESRRLPFPLEHLQGCNQFEFTLIEINSESYVKVKLSGTKVGGRILHHYGTLDVSEDGFSDHFTVTFQEDIIYQVKSIDLYIADFEPNRYLVLYSCVGVKDVIARHWSRTQDYIWVLTRDSLPDYKTIRQAESLANSLTGYGERLTSTFRAQCKWHVWEMDTEKIKFGTKSVKLDERRSPELTSTTAEVRNTTLPPSSMPFTAGLIEPYTRNPNSSVLRSLSNCRLKTVRLTTILIYLATISVCSLCLNS